MVKKLYNSLIEFIVVAGFDQNTGLLSNNAPQKAQKSENIFGDAFEPAILAVISHDKAYYPTKKEFNPDYPPIVFNKQDTSVEDAEQVSTSPNTEKKVPRKRKNSSMHDLPLQHDILDNLCQFCFPSKCNLRLNYSKWKNF
jgi:hypothetical protein